MSRQIYNGGLELGIFKIVGDENLSEKDLQRKKYLKSLPKNQWIDLDENGMMITSEEARKREQEMLKRYGIKSKHCGPDFF